MKSWTSTGLPSLKLFIALISCFLIPLANAQRTIHIPADAPTVQAGIDLANAGDTVSISPGTYGPIDFRGKAITVAGSGPGVILDGHLAIGAVVTFNSGEKRDSILQNVTVQRGVSGPTPTAGGVFIYYASPTILDSIILNNQGCGIGVVSGAPSIQGNTITGNKYGFDTPGSPGCVPNQFGGGGIELYGAASGPMNAEIIGNTIENNTDANSGAGIDAWDAGRPLIESNTIANNTGKTLGAGITIEGNTSPVIVQNLVYGNIINTNNIEVPAGADAGAAINLRLTAGEYQTLPTFIVNNTFVGNSLIGPGPQYGSQILLGLEYNNVSFYNNLIVGEDSLSPIACIPSNAVGAVPIGLPTFDNNDVWNLNDGAILYWGSCTNQTGKYGNISADPNFVTDASSQYPYELGLSSPAVDSGDNNAPMLTQTDVLGQPRIQNAKGLSRALVDLGVYEYRGVPAPTPAPTDFTLTTTPETVFVRLGQKVNLTVVVTAAAASLGKVVLGCSGLPVTVSCTFSMPALSFMNSGSQSATMTLATTTAEAVLHEHASSDLPIALEGLLILPTLLTGTQARSRHRLPRCFRIGTLLVMISLVGLSGCGNDRYTGGGTQIYQLTVQGYAVNSGLTKATSSAVTVMQ
jgi:parallel beta-helix repeat protein